MQRALILAPGDVIEPEHLLLACLTPGIPAAVPVPATASPNAADIANTPAATVRDLERQHILETLQKVGGSRTKATELLGISERTLRYKLKQYRDEGLL